MAAGSSRPARAPGSLRCRGWRAAGAALLLALASALQAAAAQASPEAQRGAVAPAPAPAPAMAPATPPAPASPSASAPALPPAPPLATPAAPGAPRAGPPTAAQPADAAPAAAAASSAAQAGPRRPRIGLVLSGGGARGLAHVGVLKVLEELQIPIDVIAGTSMGAIVGGLYASGMRAAELERELKTVRWTELFQSRVARPLLSQRLKEEDFEVSPLLELGWRDGEVQLPTSAISSRGLEQLLRRYTLPVAGLRRFDQLPIPFRAVATDMETGTPVVLDEGDLALALRSSMSVPGVFAPTEVGGRVLGDGGLVDNLPIGVARALGAEVVIAVNIGTPPGGRETLGSAVGLTAQMLNILTEQNVQRSLATLGPRDVLIAPALGTLTSSDFDAAAQLMALGESGARGRSDRLAGLSLDAAAYAAWAQQHPRPAPAGGVLAEVRIEGTTATNPTRLLAMLESRAGEPFDAARAERDARRLAAGGDYTRADYQLAPATPPASGEALVFDLADKPWGPNYLNVGLDLATDFGGRSSFNLKLSHNRRWLTPNGTEWRNRLQIGQTPRAFTEIYHPLAWTASRSNDWFVAGYAGLERRRWSFFDPEQGDELAQLKRDTGVLGFDLGQPWGEFGELRLGWSHATLATRVTLVAAALGDVGTPRVRWSEDALRARAVVDQLDFANFPQAGYRASLEMWLGRRRGLLDGSFHRIEAEGTAARSFGAHTLEAHLLLQTADQGRVADGLARYGLGGFQRLSGYQDGQLIGNHVLFMRLGWTMRLSRTPTLTRGFMVGATLEAGNAWMRRSEVALADLRTGMSLFVGADTGVGPLYFGLTYAPRGSAGLALFIGRP